MPLVTWSPSAGMRRPSLAEHACNLPPGLAGTVYQGHGHGAGQLEIPSPGQRGKSREV